MSDRIASLPDDLSAPFTDRLLLALGIHPVHVAVLGEERAIEAAVKIRSAAHRFPMVCEDFDAQVDEIERLRAAITEAVKTLDAEASNECMCLMVADDLNDALKGTTDDD